MLFSDRWYILTELFFWVFFFTVNRGQKLAMAVQLVSLKLLVSYTAFLFFLSGRTHLRLISNIWLHVSSDPLANFNLVWSL